MDSKTRREVVARFRAELGPGVAARYCAGGVEGDRFYLPKLLDETRRGNFVLMIEMPLQGSGGPWVTLWPSPQEAVDAADNEWEIDSIIDLRHGLRFESVSTAVLLPPMPLRPPRPQDLLDTDACERAGVDPTGRNH